MEEFSAHSQATLDYLKEKYQDDILRANKEFVQFKFMIDASKEVPSTLHYELHEGKMQLHFEWGALGGEWRRLRLYFIERTRYLESISWEKWQGSGLTRAILEREIRDYETLDAAIREMRTLFGDLAHMYYRIGVFSRTQDVSQNTTRWPEMDLPVVQFEMPYDPNQPVALYDLSLLDVFSLSLSIPVYQRIYCWDKKNVDRLLKDVFGADGEYRLGSIILQRKSDRYEIIDGQQRLTTLGMMFHRMGVNGIKLLDGSYKSKESRDYIAYNKYLINTFLSGRKPLSEQQIKTKMENLTFSVLVLNEDSIHLAYTFFSNQNSKGIPLADYDLLKAHHLRFIENEDRQRDKVTKWNDMLLKPQRDDTEKTHIRTLDKYLFRLRKWLFSEEWSEREPYRIKNEYEASESLPDVSLKKAFESEKTPYFEAIRGGEFFFDFVDFFVEKYNAFTRTLVFSSVHTGLTGETHWQYRDVIEALLYAYFLKYGTLYLSEAALLISRAVSAIRLNGKKANYESLMEEIGELKIASKIESSGEPAILFRELTDFISGKRIIIGNYKILQRYKFKLESVLLELCSTVSLDSVKQFAVL